MNLKQARISSIKLPGDIKLAETEATDSGLVNSVKDNGVLVPIIIDEKNNLVCGRNRVVAAKLNGLKTIPAIVRKGAGRAETIIENLHRRHLSKKERDALIKEYVTLLTQSHVHSERTHASKKDAIEKVANETGLSDSTVTRAVDGPRVGNWGVDEESIEGGIPGFESWGMDLDDDEVAAFKAAIKDWEFVRSTAAILGKRVGALSARIDMTGWVNSCVNLSSIAKQEKPAALCPWCKHHPSLTGDCAYCMGAGWTAAHSAAEAPDELKSGAARVVRKGKVVLFSKVK